MNGFCVPSAADIPLRGPRDGGCLGRPADWLFPRSRRWLGEFRCWWRGHHLFGPQENAAKLACRTCRKLVDQVSPDGRFRMVYWPVQ